MMTNAEVAAALDAELNAVPTPGSVSEGSASDLKERGILDLCIVCGDNTRASGGERCSECTPSALIAGAVQGGVYVPAGYEVEAPAPTPPSAKLETGAAFPFDASLPDPRGMRVLFPSQLSFAQVALAWAEQIRAEAHHDFKVSSADLRMREEDGALTRGKPGGLAYTRHGFGQLVNLLLAHKPNNLAGCLRWLRPARRSAAFNLDVMPRTTRKADDLMVLRTFAAARPGAEGQTVRAVRAVVSTRHSQAALDDLNMMNALQAELGTSAPTDCARSIDETHGVAVVGTTAKHLHRTLHWTNSETGCASMSFTAGAVIRFLDAMVRLDGTTDTVAVTLEDENTRSTMRHTAPGGKKSPEQQAKVANDRMRERIRDVLKAGEAVEGMWERALVDYPVELRDRDGDDGRERFLKMGPEQAFEVLGDLLEEVGDVKSDDRDLLLAVLKDEKRLEQLPRGSAAHVAAAFAVLGARAEDNAKAMHWQGVAGRWISRGWPS